MQVSFDQYIRNLRMFYNQLVKGHSKEDKLSAQFKLLLQNENKKWRKVIAVRRENRNGETAALLAKLKEKKGGGKNGSKVSVEVLYASKDIKNLIVFGYCFLLMEHKNATALEFLTEGMKVPLADKEVFNEPMLRKVRNLWDKMEQVVAGKRRLIRFQKQLQDCFKDIPQTIMDPLFAIIVSNNKITSTEPEQFMAEITRLLGIKVQYFRINEREQIQYMTYGQTFETEMKFGLFIKDGFYGYVSRLPQKQEVQVNKEITMSCFGQISQNLGTMYKENEKEYQQLNTVNSKIGKLRRAGSLATTKAVESRFTSTSIGKLQRRSSSMNFSEI